MVASSGPCTGLHWMQPGSVLSAPPCRIDGPWVGSLLVLLQAKQLPLSQPPVIEEVFQSLHHLGSPPLDFFQYVQYVHLSRTGSPDLDTVLQVQPHRAKVMVQNKPATGEVRTRAVMGAQCFMIDMENC